MNTNFGSSYNTNFEITREDNDQNNKKDKKTKKEKKEIDPIQKKNR